jgi:hypothetical protein
MYSEWVPSVRSRACFQQYSVNHYHHSVISPSTGGHTLTVESMWHFRKWTKKEMGSSDRNILLTCIEKNSFGKLWWMMQRVWWNWRYHCLLMLWSNCNRERKSTEINKKDMCSAMTSNNSLLIITWPCHCWSMTCYFVGSQQELKSCWLDYCLWVLNVPNEGLVQVLYLSDHVLPA